MLTFRTYFYLIWFPFAVLLVAGGAPLVMAATPPGAAFYPLFGSLILAAVAVWFKRSRTAQLATIFGIFGYCLMLLLPGANPTKGYDGQVIFALIAFLVPLNATIITFLPNRLLISISGLARVLVIALQALAIYVLGNNDVNLLSADLAQHFDKALIDLLHFRLLPKEIDIWTFLPQPALLLTGLALAVLLLRLMVTAAAEDAALMLALLGFALALHRVDNNLAAFSFHMACQIIFMGALVHEAYRMAFVDELTEIANRRALDNMLGSLRGQYSLAMLDIDHFKNFNDNHGHDVGDQVLKMVATCVAKTGSGGRAFRYGGEEFTVIFPGRTLDDARIALEALRLDVMNAKFSLRGTDRPVNKPRPANKNTKKASHPESVSVTISIGLAAPDENTMDAKYVIKAADKALYKAKKAGRNRLAE